jgi:hypothetical protein
LWQFAENLKFLVSLAGQAAVLSSSVNRFSASFSTLLHRIEQSVGEDDP